MLLLAGNVRPLTSAPCGRRDLLTTELGPEASGSKPGKEGCDQMPEKSGMAAGATAGPAVWPKADVIVATASIVSKPISHCLCMTVSLSWLVGATIANGYAPAMAAAPRTILVFRLFVTYRSRPRQMDQEPITKMTDEHLTPKPTSLPPMADLAAAQSLLRTVFGFAEFRAGQAEIMETILAGRDVLAVMPTGSGESQLHQWFRREPHHRGADRAGRIAPRLCGARAARQAGNCCAPAARQCRPAGGRRGPLHLAMGPRFPPRLHESRGPAERARPSANHRVYGDRGRRDAG